MPKKCSFSQKKINREHELINDFTFQWYFQAILSFMKKLLCELDWLFSTNLEFFVLDIFFPFYVKLKMKFESNTIAAYHIVIEIMDLKNFHFCLRECQMRHKFLIKSFHKNRENWKFELPYNTNKLYAVLKFYIQFFEIESRSSKQESRNMSNSTSG